MGNALRRGRSEGSRHAYVVTDTVSPKQRPGKAQAQASDRSVAASTYAEASRSSKLRVAEVKIRLPVSSAWGLRCT